MASKTTYTCDRCGNEMGQFDVNLVELVYIKGKLHKDQKDLCPSCTQELMAWLEGPLLTPPGYVEKCSHNITCAGPCNDPYLVRA